MPQTPDSLFAQRELMPTTLSSAELAKIAAEIRERSVFSARVYEASIVDKIRSSCAAVLRGELSESDARRVLREALEAINYAPPADKQGTIEDVMSTPRLDLIVKTNVAQAQGYYEQKQLLDAPEPMAWQLYRAEQRMAPRDWDTRWQIAYSQLSPDEKKQVNPQAKVALVGCRIWALLSRFGQAYPPFDYNSGMDVMTVYADDFGLGAVPRPAPSTSLNEDVAMAAPESKSLREWIAQGAFGQAGVKFNNNQAILKND